ncbi:MAG: hypothetical protein ACJAZF_002306 [Granulosicoccus sp.]|jgi:hypothetical protein
MVTMGYSPKSALSCSLRIRSIILCNSGRQPPKCTVFVGFVPNRTVYDAAWACCQRSLEYPFLLNQQSAAKGKSLTRLPIRLHNCSAIATVLRVKTGENGGWGIKTHTLHAAIQFNKQSKIVKAKLARRSNSQPTNKYAKSVQ